LLEVGNGGMSDIEYRSQVSLWAIMASPLIVANDLTKATPATLDILSNREVIAINQDPLALSGFRVGTGGAYGGGIEVWSKPLSDCGARAVALFNRNNATTDISVSWAAIGLAPGAAAVRDLWAKADLGSVSDTYTAHVPAHGTALLKIVGTEVAPPTGDKLLSDLPWIYAANSVGPAERDLSNKERIAKDGTPLSINGKHYDKGLGVHAASLVMYRLAGACTSFTSDVGVDDEAGGLGSVVFQVWADGSKLFDSGIMKGKMPAKTLSVDVTGKSELSLFVDNGGDDRHQDHVDWASAELKCK
jgi:alpha-galactosidase